MEVMLFVPGSSAIGALLGLFGVLVWRLREGSRPVTLKTIVLPPLGMATGFSMFVVSGFRVPLAWALGAFLIGALVLAYPLIRTSRLVLKQDTVMMHRSRVFFMVVLILFAVRYFARDYVGKIISVQQTAGLFFILAFGMIVVWRTAMFFEYKRLVANRIPDDLARPSDEPEESNLQER
jgi:membrane protein CcdC involved in cytochrome C biogenesis